MHSHNEKLFIWIYERFYDRIFLVAYNILQNKDDAKDVVQNVFTRLWNNKRYKEITRVESYLKKACKRACLDFIEKHNNRTSWNGEFGKLAPEYEDEAFSSSFDMRDHFVAAYEQLTRQQREVLELLFLRNCSYQEAADIMGITKNTLKAYRRSVINILRNKFTSLIKK